MQIIVSHTILISNPLTSSKLFLFWQRVVICLTLFCNKSIIAKIDMTDIRYQANTLHQLRNKQSTRLCCVLRSIISSWVSKGCSLIHHFKWKSHCSSYFICVHFFHHYLFQTFTFCKTVTHAHKHTQYFAIWLSFTYGFATHLFIETL